LIEHGEHGDYGVTDLSPANQATAVTSDEIKYLQISGKSGS